MRRFPTPNDRRYTQPLSSGPPGQTDLEPVADLEGTVVKVVYENPDNGYIVARILVPAKTEPVTIVGSLLTISPGERVRVTGRWVEDRRFGKQIQVTSCETILPGTVEGIEQYLGSGLVPGIGPEYARRLVQTFGEETLTIIDRQPKRLRSVPGIGPKRAAKIAESWSSRKSVHSVMMFLQGCGVTPGFAVKIFREYGGRASSVVRDNPFRLAEDITGIGFHTADQIARKLGIAADAPSRIRAGVMHVLGNASGEGHLFLERTQLTADSVSLLKVDVTAVEEAVTVLASTGKIVAEDEACYTAQMHAAERGCADGLKRLLRTPREPVPIHIENALKWVEQQKNISLSPEQRDAVRMGCESKVLVITGGPGTGKTTVLNSLLAILEKKGLSFLLAAPTGRAAKRIEAATGRDARTIHRLLEFSPKTAKFQKDDTNPLVTDMLVVDEASMIDTQLMDSLLRALPSFARLLLVGDVDQLPSVGPGNVLYDIIACGLVPVVRLNTVFRQAGDSGIISNAHRINRGEMPEFNDTDFVFVKREDPAEALETIVELVARRIPARFGLDPVRDVQILAPLRRGDAGVGRINESVKAAINPDAIAVPRRDFGLGDKVMQLRNNYDLEVFNGDTGVVVGVDLEASELEVAFDDGRQVLFPFEDADNLVPAYCATVHKSQGSEYPAVVLAFLSQHYMMLQRNVLYTAVTRGKKLVVIVGSKKAIAMAIHNNRIAHRNTRLTERLRNEL